MDKPTVFTYHQSIPGLGTGSDQTLELWSASWKANGWNPIVLNETHATKHKLYATFRAKIESFPSVNALGFDYHAFMRHLAVAAYVPNSHVIFTTEPDVINYSLGSDAFLWRKPEILECHSPVPAFLIGYKPHFEALVAAICSYSLLPDDQEDGRPHLSDQNFLHYRAGDKIVRYFRHSPMCAEAFQGQNWIEAPTVHYGTPYMMASGLLPKHKFIPSLRPLPKS